jgi:hypothetical protein
MDTPEARIAKAQSMLLALGQMTAATGARLERAEAQTRAQTAAMARMFNWETPHPEFVKWEGHTVPRYARTPAQVKKNQNDHYGMRRNRNECVYDIHLRDPRQVDIFSIISEVSHVAEAVDELTRQMAHTQEAMQWQDHALSETRRAHGLCLWPNPYLNIGFQDAGHRPPVKGDHRSISHISHEGDMHKQLTRAILNIDEIARTLRMMDTRLKAHHHALKWEMGAARVLEGRLRHADTFDLQDFDLQASDDDDTLWEGTGNTTIYSHLPPPPPGPVYRPPDDEPLHADSPDEPEARHIPAPTRYEPTPDTYSRVRTGRVPYDAHPGTSRVPMPAHHTRA